MVLAKNRHIDQWDRIESPEIRPYVYGYLIFDKGVKLNGERIVSSINGIGKTGYSHAKKKEIGPLSYTTQKITLRYIKDLNIRPTVKLIEENLGGKFLHIGFGNYFFNLTPKAQATNINTKIKKWDDSKPKSFCTAKETINKMKRQPAEWGNIFANLYLG